MSLFKKNIHNNTLRTNGALKDLTRSFALSQIQDLIWCRTNLAHSHWGSRHLANESPISGHGKACHVVCLHAHADELKQMSDVEGSGSSQHSLLQHPECSFDDVICVRLHRPVAVCPLFFAPHQPTQVLSKVRVTTRQFCVPKK